MLVGFETSDDAGVYRLRDDLALVQTVDFFTPIVDDPFDFGRIAATNALSDIYAMGATPVSALNLVAFSLEELGEEVLLEILRGGRRRRGGGRRGDHRRPLDRGRRAEVRDGGHRGRPSRRGDHQRRRAGPGDALVLTKPLGAGAISTAVKRGLPGAALDEAVQVMTTLNRDAAAAARAAGAHAMTDVTGFGLLGHLHELGAGERGRGRARRRGGPGDRRACSGCYRTTRSARSPAGPGATAPTPRSSRRSPTACRRRGAGWCATR